MFFKSFEKIPLIYLFGFGFLIVGLLFLSEEEGYKFIKKLHVQNINPVAYSFVMPEVKNIHLVMSDSSLGKSVILDKEFIDSAFKAGTPPPPPPVYVAPEPVIKAPPPPPLKKDYRLDVQQQLKVYGVTENGAFINNGYYAFGSKIDVISYQNESKGGKLENPYLIGFKKKRDNSFLMFTVSGYTLKYKYE